MKLIINLILMALFIPSLSYAEDKPNHDMKKTGVESLSPKLRALLAKEMLALQKGMQAIIPAYVSGNWSQVEYIAEKMQNSYILKQSLTEEQKKELHASLPHSFITLDKEFHYLAGMLKHVSEKKKSELVGFYFSKLSESCVSCHSQYATHRFPEFAPKKQSDKHSH